MWECKGAVFQRECPNTRLSYFVLALCQMENWRLLWEAVHFQQEAWRVPVPQEFRPGYAPYLSYPSRGMEMCVSNFFSWDEAWVTAVVMEQKKIKIMHHLFICRNLNSTCSHNILTNIFVRQHVALNNLPYNRSHTNLLQKSGICTCFK